MKNKIFLILFICFTSAAIAQSDSSAYTLWKNKLILHSSIGYNSAPFSFKYPYPNKVDKLRFKANMNPVLRFGFSYKWAALQIGFKLPGYLRNTAEYGKTEYFDLGFEFGIKKWHFDFDLHLYRGFSVRNAEEISPTINSNPNFNKVRKDLTTSSFSINTFYFYNADFKMKPTKGIVGKYNKKTTSFYLKPTINLFGIGGAKNILPYQFIDTVKTILRGSNFAAFDLGVVPGYAYMNYKKGFQYGFRAGLGAVIQSKFFGSGNVTRGFLGLAPRIDFQAVVGYNIKKWFVMLNAEVDNKSIRFNDLKYQQNYHSIWLTAGWRFK